jgi:hypothetical protein
MLGMVTVKAPIRRRTRHDEPVSEDIEWLEETAPTYEEARDAIRARVPEDWLILAWYADDEHRRRLGLRGSGES